MTHYRFKAALSLTCAAIAFPAAAETGPNMEYVGDDILVSGDILQSNVVASVKTPTPIIDVPQSLSITTDEQIEERGWTSVSELINYTPGVNNSQGEGHRDSVVFRGIRSTADFFIDGNRDDVQYYRSLYNIEQVEILRGPNALLFGRGGAGGVLNRVSKKGEFNENFAGGQVAVDTFGEYSVFADLNLSSSEQVAFRINAAYESLDNHRDFYDGERIGFNPTARFAAGEDTTVDLSYEYANHDRFIDRGIPTGVDGRPVEAFDEITFGDAQLNFSDLEAHLFRANVSHNFSDNWKGILNAFYGDYEKVYSNFYASGYNQLATPDVVTTDGYIDTTTRDNLILSGNLVGEFKTGALGHTLLVGGEYIRTNSRQDRINPVWSDSQDDNEDFIIQRPLTLRGGVGIAANGNPTSVIFDRATSLNDDTDVDIEVFSIFVQDEIEVAEWLNVVVGGRFDSFDIEVLDLAGTNGLRTRKDEEFSPRGGIIIKPQENISVYASYSKSFLPRSGEQFANINGTANALDPDTFTNLEAGIKWDFDTGLSLTAAVFDIEQSSPQPSDTNPETLDVINSNIQGFEIQLQGEVLPGWTMQAGYSYLDGRQVDAFGVAGLRPRELPENMLSIWNQVEVTDRFGLGLGITHQSESFITNDTISYEGLNGDVVTTRATLPSFTRVDAAAYYEVSDNWRVQVNVENLTDTTYFPDAHSTHQATVGAPINARFAVSGRF